VGEVQIAFNLFDITSLSPPLDGSTTPLTFPLMSMFLLTFFKKEVTSN
jgi:hypothetical protein